MLGHGPREPKIEITQLTDEVMKFTLYDTDQGMANALRRVMLSEVPTLAIDLVTIEENTSVFFDEFLAHRLGLLPINSRKVEKYNYTRDCTCMTGGGCPFCTVKYSLDVINEKDEAVVVTHLDISCNDLEEGQQDGVEHLQDRESWPMPVPIAQELGMSKEDFAQTHGIPIVKLKKNQQFKATMIANKGCGKAHAKYNPCQTVVFAYEPDIRINAQAERALTVDQKIQVIKSCPKDVFELDDMDRLVAANPSACIFCDQCSVLAGEELDSPQLIRVDQKQDRFHFTVESTGARPPQDIVRQSMDLLKAKFDTIEKEIEALDEDQD